MSTLEQRLDILTVRLINEIHVNVFPSEWIAMLQLWQERPADRGGLMRRPEPRRWEHQDVWRGGEVLHAHLRHALHLHPGHAHPQAGLCRGAGGSARNILQRGGPPEHLWQGGVQTTARRPCLWLPARAEWYWGLLLHIQSVSRCTCTCTCTMYSVVQLKTQNTVTLENWPLES